MEGATVEVTAATRTTRPPAGSGGVHRMCSRCCFGFREHVLPFVLLICFGATLLFLGPLVGLLFALFILFVYIASKERRRLVRLASNSSGPQSSTALREQRSSPADKADDLSSLILRAVEAAEPPCTCEICLEDIQEGDQVAGSPNPECIHEFHVHCIYQALQRQTTCPCCRREYVLPAESSSTDESPPRVPLADEPDIEHQGTPMDVGDQPPERSVVPVGEPLSVVTP
jgi:Ring finger domain